MTSWLGSSRLGDSQSRSGRVSRARLLAALGLGIAMLAVTPGWTSEDPRQNSKMFMTNASRFPCYADGEPQFALNPLNPKNMVVAWTTHDQSEGCPNVQVGTHPGNPVRPPIQPCAYSVTYDRGVHWTKPQPIRTTSLVNSGCGDPFTGAGPDGTLYVGTVVFGAAGLADPTGALSMIHSTDGGRTWSMPSEFASSLTVLKSLPQVRPYALPGAQASPWERPYMTVDQSTGTLYVSSCGYTDREAPEPSTAHGRAYLWASTDRGMTWIGPQLLGNEDFPGDWCSPVSAANGVVSYAYMASAAPGVTCPCVIFETSTDLGATWHRHVVASAAKAEAEEYSCSDTLGLLASGSPLYCPIVAADPVHRGRYAVSKLSADSKHILVYLTRDSGRTWSKASKLGEAPANPRFKTAMAFSPNGALGVMWRTQHPDGTFDAWAAVAPATTSNKLTFGPPTRMSPPAKPAPAFPAGDDISGIVLDRNYLHTGIGFNPTPDDMDVIYARLRYRG
jgi:photosystem II stability/assembly factor-like uncharacterized protein